MATTADMFAIASHQHQAGNLNEAEQLYRQILQAEPRHADAHHLLGVCAYQKGRHEEAVAFIKQAIALSPSIPGFYCNLGLVHQAQGKIEEAAACYQHVLLLQPNSAEAHGVLGNLLRALGKLDDAEAHCRHALQARPGFAGAHINLGLVLADKGQLEEAIFQYREALCFEPNYVAAHNNLGHALLMLGKLDEAAFEYRQALRRNPNFPEAHNGLGNVLRTQGKSEEAIPYIREALRLRPGFAEAHNNMGNALLQLGRKDEAEAQYKQALALRPDYGEAHNNMGAVLSETRPEEAEACCREAIRLKNNFAEAHNNLGNVLLRLGQTDEAITCFRRAIELKPTFAEAHNNLGTAIKEHGQIDEGIESLEHALMLKPNYTEARWNRSLIWLLKGDLERGLPEYEYRWQRPGFTWRTLAKPQWDGSELNGRTILLWAEQGLGDTIHFIRYASVVKERGGRVIFESQPPLMRLLADAPGIDQLIERGASLPPFDVHAPLLSLPRILRTDSATIPASVPYLQADAKLVEYWRKELESIKGFRIGIAWQGNPEYISDRQRSMPLEHFERLARIEGVSLISLQKGPGIEQISSVKDKFPVIDLGERLDKTSGPFMDTAAILKNLDLVITSDTALPHLAGALGVPVWLALPLVPDWRWQLQREDSPWYPTLRLFRQSSYGVWEPVFERIAEELMTQVKSKV